MPADNKLNLENISSRGLWKQPIKCPAKHGFNYSSFGSGSATVGSMASERSVPNHVHTKLENYLLNLLLEIPCSGSSDSWSLELSPCLA